MTTKNRTTGGGIGGAWAVLGERNWLGTDTDEESAAHRFATVIYDWIYSDGTSPPREGLPWCVREYLSFDDRHASWHDADACLGGDDRDADVPLTRYTVRAGVGVPRPVPNHPYSHGIYVFHVNLHTDDLEEAKAAWARAECYVNYAEPPWGKSGRERDPRGEGAD